MPQQEQYAKNPDVIKVHNFKNKKKEKEKKKNQKDTNFKKLQIAFISPEFFKDASRLLCEIRDIRTNLNFDKIMIVKFDVLLFIKINKIV